MGVISETTPETAPSLFSSLYETLTSYSIFHAQDIKRLEKEKERNINLTSFEKGRLGVRAAFFTLVPTLALALVSSIFIRSKISKLLPISEITFAFFFDASVVAPVFEELLCRSMLQTAFFYRTLKMTPQKSILYSNTFFAFMHSGIRLDILAYPVEGILQYTTGSIEAPVACHATNNFIKSVLSFLF